MALTDQQYYSSASNYGDSQFVSLKDIVNNFYLFYIGDEKLINNVKKSRLFIMRMRSARNEHSLSRRDKI